MAQTGPGFEESVAATVREYFENFLTNFCSESALPPDGVDDQPREYIEQVRTTL